MWRLQLTNLGALVLAGILTLIGFVVGIGLGAALASLPSSGTPPSPSPSPILSVVDEKLIDRLTCEAMVAGAIIGERLRLTGKPNPPVEEK